MNGGQHAPARRALVAGGHIEERHGENKTITLKLIRPDRADEHEASDDDHGPDES
ncbi:MAG: hypothetical protein ACR2HP_13790 [Ilumatobacteraceae bacterium]